MVIRLFLYLKKKSYTTCSEKHRKNTHVDYQRKGVFSVLSHSYPLFNLIALYFLLNVNE